MEQIQLLTKRQQKKKTIILLMPIEQDFSKILPLWIKHLHNLFYESKPLPVKYQNKLLNYPTCFVGDLRTELGIRSFGSLRRNENVYGCNACRMVADVMYSEDITRKDYIDALGFMKSHLDSGHNIRLD